LYVDEFLNGFPLPEENEHIAKVLNSRGTNILELQMSNGDIELSILPNKFKKLIWVKRNDYVIVSSYEDNGNNNSTNDCKVKHVIKYILNSEKIAYIKSKNLW
jgi:probable RNA-binding protein EIF1AD